MTKQTGGGAFDRTERHLYFLASGAANVQRGSTCHPYGLVPVNELRNEGELALLEEMLEDGVKILLDSGVYSLASDHARKHDMHHNDALALAPDDIDGFQALYDRYCYLLERFEDQLWGYIEIDQGGRENKIKTRARLEAQGLRPIPVYHPLIDGWDYFDELAQEYDRICVGNIVQAPGPVRKRLLATLVDRKRRYPHLWIHALGMSPHEMLNAYPADSVDASSWLTMIRWLDSHRERALCTSVGTLSRGYIYERGTDKAGERGYHKAQRFGGYTSYFVRRNWASYLNRLAELGCCAWPMERNVP